MAARRTFKTHSRIWKSSVTLPKKQEERLFMPTIEFVLLYVVKPGQLYLRLKTN